MIAMKELPKEPKGWTRRMTLHLNYGRDGGVGAYEVRDEAGELTPITYHYDTRKGGQTGFALPGIEPLMTWTELRDMWPVWLAKQDESGGAVRDEGVST